MSGDGGGPGQLSPTASRTTAGRPKPLTHRLSLLFSLGLPFLSCFLVLSDAPPAGGENSRHLARVSAKGRRRSAERQPREQAPQARPHIARKSARMNAYESTRNKSPGDAELLIGDRSGRAFRGRPG